MCKKRATVVIPGEQNGGMQRQKLMRLPSQCVFTSSLKNFFYFEIIIDPHATVRNNTKKFHIYLIQLPPIVTSCKTTENITARILTLMRIQLLILLRLP